VEVLGEEAPLFYTVQAAFPDHPYPRLANADTPAHLLVDVTPVLKQKTDAALCHRTQHDLFIRHRSEEAGRRLTVPETILPIESLHRVFPPVEDASALDDPLADLLIASTSARRAG
jgi:LmbE family N-acetylglucosaminyl deacetylase